MYTLVRGGFLGLALLLPVFGQAGHYEGKLALPNREIQLTLDLDKTDKGWIGSVSLTPGPSGLTVDKITIDAENIAWAIAMPNAPSFKGKLDSGTNTMKGSLTSPAGDLPVELKRTGEAKVSVPKESTPLSPKALGSWTAVLQPPGGPQLHLTMELANSAPGGKASAKIVSVDQSPDSIPIASIVQTGNTIDIDMRMIGGRYSGTLSEDGNGIDGTLTQNGANIPLKFTRPKQAQPAAKP